MGLKGVLDYLKIAADVWGFEVSCRVGILTPLMPLPTKKEQENDRKLEKAAFEFHNALKKERGSPGLRDILVFFAQRASFEELGERSSADYAYGKEKGWLNPGAKYYVDVPVNPVCNGWLDIRTGTEKKNSKGIERNRRLIPSGPEVIFTVVHIKIS